MLSVSNETKRMFTMTRYHLAAVIALAGSLFLGLLVLVSAQAAPYDYSGDPCSGLRTLEWSEVSRL